MSAAVVVLADRRSQLREELLELESLCAALRFDIAVLPPEADLLPLAKRILSRSVRVMQRCGRSAVAL